jgi:acetyltransferase-like isoleucine patch superfamily enzyme
MLQGCSIGAKTALPTVFMTWPHQVRLGERCIIEQGVYFKFDGIWSPGPSIVIDDRCFIGAFCEFNIRRHIRIGADSAIASGCKFIDHDHGITGQRLDETPGKEVPINLGRNVWLGVNVVVLKGVTIGDGAVVGAGAVVIKSIPAGEIWAGVPAVKIGIRPENFTVAGREEA